MFRSRTEKRSYKSGQKSGRFGKKQYVHLRPQQSTSHAPAVRKHNSPTAPSRWFTSWGKVETCKIQNPNWSLQLVSGLYAVLLGLLQIETQMHVCDAKHAATHCHRPVFASQNQRNLSPDHSGHFSPPNGAAVAIGLITCDNSHSRIWSTPAQ